MCNFFLLNQYEKYCTKIKKLKIKKMKKTILLLVFLASHSVKAVESNLAPRHLESQILGAFAVRDKHEAYKEEIDTIDGKIENAEKKIKCIKSEIERKKQERSNKNQEMRSHDGEISNMHSAKEQLDARITTLQEEEKNRGNNWHTINKEIEEKITATQKALDNAKSETDRLVVEHADAQAQCTQMENNRKAELDRLNKALDEAQKQLANLQRKQNTHNHKTNTQQTKVQKINSHIEDLYHKIKNKENEKLELSVAIVEQDNSVKAIDQSINALYQAKKEMQKTAITAATASLQKEIEDLKTSGSIEPQDDKKNQEIYSKIFRLMIEKGNKEEELKSSMENFNTWYPADPCMQNIKSALETFDQDIVTAKREKQEAEMELVKRTKQKHRIQEDQEKICAQLKQAHNDLINAQDVLNTLGDGQQQGIQGTTELVDNLKRARKERSGYTPEEQEILNTEKASAKALSQNQALCRQKTEELKILEKEKVNKQNAYDQETKARKDRIDALDLKIKNQPKKLAQLEEKQTILGDQIKTIEEEISRLIKEWDNGQKILAELRCWKVHAKDQMNALSHSSDQIKNDITQYVKNVAHSLTDSIMDLGCKDRAVYMSRLYRWALTEQSGMRGSSGEIDRFCDAEQKRLNKAEDQSLLVEAVVQFMLQEIPGILCVEKRHILQLNGGTMKTSCSHACGDACNVCIEKGQPINQTGFADIVSVVNTIHSLHPIACRIAQDIQGVASARPLMEQGMQLDLAYACRNVANADNLDNLAEDSLVSAVVWACQHYNSTEYKPAANNPILMDAESYINSPSFQGQLQDMSDEAGKVWQWLKESVDKDKKCLGANDDVGVAGMDSPYLSQSVIQHSVHTQDMSDEARKV